MKVLPGVTRPWRKKIARRHQPPPVHGAEGYRRYRPCLRWEFGFSCAFCLCHEADLVLAGVEGWAVTQVEHFALKSRAAARRNDYLNCFFICRLCNSARGTTPNRDARGRELLDPCSAVWAEHFDLHGDEIRPRGRKSSDAAYTAETYDLADPRKTRLRRLRRETVDRRLDFLRRSQGMEDELLDEMEAGGRADPVRFVDLARTIRDARNLALEDLLRFRPVPSDAAPACLCGRDDLLTLPAVLDEQTLDLPDLLRPSPPPTRGAR